MIALRPFIPRWLDETPFRPEVHRVLSHLWRRADRDGWSWPSVGSIARVCGLEVKTVRRALKELETAGYVVRKEMPGRVTQYMVVMRDVESSDTPPVRPPHPRGTRGSQTAPHPRCQTEGQGGSQAAGDPSREAPPEGYPEKDPQEGNPREGVAPPPVFLLSDEQRQSLAKEFGITIAGAQEAERVYRQNKTPFIAKDGPLSFDGLAGWLRTSRDGKSIRERSRPVGEVGIGETPEPSGWQIAMPVDDEDAMYRNTSWERIPAFYQRRIASKASRRWAANGAQN